MSSDRFRSLAIGTSEEGRGAKDVANRYWLRVGKRDVRLRPGETAIGRGEDCEIVVNEVPVSRRHARIILTTEELAVEDLGSMNGTFLNGSTVYGRHRLRPGDRITVGSTNIDVIEVEPISAPTSAPRRKSHRSVSVTPSISRLARWASSKPPVRRESPDPARPDRVRTLNLETLESAGRLADRMFAAGRPHAARWILEEPFQDILEGAQSGATLDAALVDAVGRYAVKLAHEVLEARWVDLAVEIHLLACRPLQSQTIRQITLLGAKGPKVSRSLMDRYFERLESRMASMDMVEQRLCGELAALISTLR